MQFYMVMVSGLAITNLTVLIFRLKSREVTFSIKSTFFNCDGNTIQIVIL